jgi:NTE family protein
LPLNGPKPVTLGEAASRMQDLIFAAQSRRSIDRWKAAYAGNEGISLLLVRLAYTEQEKEVAGKALDFSGPTVEQRWAAGYRAGMRTVVGVQTETMSIGTSGLNVIQL